MSEDKPVAPGTVVSPVPRSPRAVHSLTMPQGFRVNARDEQVPLIKGDTWVHPESKAVLAQYDGKGWILTGLGVTHLEDTKEPVTDADPNKETGAGDDGEEDKGEFDGTDQVEGQ